MSAIGQTSSETVTVTANRLSSTTFKTTTSPTCYVDIYPFEGDSFTLSNAQIMRATITKNIKQPVGQFELILAPQTLAQYQSWTQIITPMSLAVITMQRGDHANVVMIGIVRTISEPQEWVSGQPVRRQITVTGMDIAYYFTMVDFYSLWFLAVNNQAATDITADGLLSGNPGTVGQTWWTKIIASSTGVFGNTFIPYKDAQVKFMDIFGTQFDQYPTFIPFSDYFLGANGSWVDKFNKIFPFPIYEFFVTTAINGNYNATAGAAISSIHLGDNVASSGAVIARINPLPKLVTSAAADGTASFDSIDVSAWNALPQFDLEGASFISTTPGFSDEGALNFYNLNPTWLNALQGVSNSNINMGTLLYAYALDLASIARYGYRPLMFDTIWFSDPAGQGAKQDSQGTQQSFARVLGEVAGYYEAAPLMASAQMTTWLRPDIQIGCRFSYNPFRANELWDFYVETVQHVFEFGQGSATTLELTRGLPHSVYNNSGTGGVLFNIHIGNAQKVNGVYQTGLPKGSSSFLKSLTPNQFSTLVATLNSMYTTPQATVTTQGGP